MYRRRGSAVQTEDKSRLGGTCLGDTLVALVKHCLDFTEVRTGEDDVADAERTVLHEHGSDVAAAFVERRFDNRTDGLAVGVGTEFEHLGLEEHFLHEFLHAYTLLGRNILRLVFAAPLLYEVVHIGELLLDFVGIGGRLVYLVDGEYDGYAGCRSVVDGLDGLRHDVVVGGHDDDTEVGHLGTARTHGGERLVTRGVEERDMASVLEFDVVGADMLCNTSGLACNDVGRTDIVEKRCLTVVHVTHDGDNRRTRHEFVLGVLLLMYGLDHFGRNVFRLEAELLGNDVDGLGVETLVDRHHHADVHTRGDDLVDGHIHHRGEVVGGNEFGELERTALHVGHFGGLTLAGSERLTFFLTPLGGFLLALVL